MEVVLALGLVVIMALAIVGIFSRLMSRSAYSADQAAAQLLAQALLDKAIRMGPPDWGGSTGARELASGDQSATTLYNWKVEGRELPDSVHDLGRLYRVTVTVDWSDAASGARQNNGRMLVERSRLAYVEQAGP